MSPPRTPYWRSLGRDGIATAAIIAVGARLRVVLSFALIAAVLVLAPPAHAAAPPDFAAACPPATPGFMTCLALHRTDLPPLLSVLPPVTPPGFGPADLQSAYRLPAGFGSGRTVAVVDAFDDPNVESDLAVYRAQYSLPACTSANGCFSVLNQDGLSTPLPAASQTWAEEISLDVDMVSAACPLCHILVVEANSNSVANLMAAVDTAVANATYVSMSFAGAEYSGQTSQDAHFNHPGVVFTASSGDSGYGAAYPATSQYVTAVGGTSLARATNARGWTEDAWGGAGSGCSAYDPKPSWQSSATGCNNRAEADVAAVANPDTGVAVYTTYGSDRGWSIFGGTSAGAPFIAGVYAVAGAPGPADYPASYPHLKAGLEFDITAGSNGTCGAPMCTAGWAWDGPTGRGTPNGPGAFSSFTVDYPGNQTAVADAPASLTLSASGGTAPYTWSAVSLPAGLSIDPATGVVSGIPTTVGSTFVGFTAIDAVGTPSMSGFTWTIQEPDVLVPDLQGYTVSAAAGVLAAVGLSISGVGRVVDTTCNNIGKVVTQSPLGGSIAPRHSSVFVYVGTRWAGCP